MEYHDGTPRSISNIPDTPAKLTLSVVADELYEIRTAAITLDQGQVGSLKLGSRFDLRRYNMAGDMALLRRGKILRATFPQAEWAPIEKRRAGCTQKNDCEILRAEETLLAMPVP